MTIYERYQDMAALRGISGCEDQVREYILGAVEGFCESTETDPMGNLIVHKKGLHPAAHKVLLSAHMDEVGFIITYIEDSGMLRFSAVGGILPPVTAGRMVEVGPNRIPGVIGCKPIHVLTPEEKEKYTPLSEMLIDIGASSKEEAAKMVTPGDQATFMGSCTDLGEDCFCGRAADDRAGCAMLIELIRCPLPYDCTFVFSVQEETGCAGAKAAAFSQRPEIAIAVECTSASDLAGVPGHKTICALNKGPVISFMDKGTIYDRQLYRDACAAADKAGIPWQTKELVAGGNESRSYQAGAAGAKVLAVSTPTRYIHSASCVASKKDLEDGAKLLEVLIETFGG